MLNWNTINKNSKCTMGGKIRFFPLFLTSVFFMNLYETSVFIAEFERKDLYSYYGVNEDNIKNKTERYSALIKGIEFLTNKGGVL